MSFFQIYISFHRQNLLTDSDRRKYKDLFAKVIACETTTSLPVLSAMSTVQSKPKFVKGPATIMPTNLLPSTLIENEPSTTTTATTMSSSNAQSSESPAPAVAPNSCIWMNVQEVPRQPLPLIPSAKNSNKAQLARQVTNVIKRHNFEARQQITDKVI